MKTAKYVTTVQFETGAGKVVRNIYLADTAIAVSHLIDEGESLVFIPDDLGNIGECLYETVEVLDDKELLHRAGYELA